MSDLFDDLPPSGVHEELQPGAAVLRGFARDDADVLRACIDLVIADAPFRHLVTPGGRTMSVAMTNCGAQGWVSDRRGYRYEPTDPATGAPWPAMPQVFLDLARRAAAECGWSDYRPDCCLVNRYLPGTALSLHQDRDEQDRNSPIVSVSLGLPAIFLWGGATRAAPVRRIRLASGDVVVWGGPARFVFHGVARLAPVPGACGGGSAGGGSDVRINLTFRCTGI